MEHLLLAYVFVCFSMGLVCMGIIVALTHPRRNPVARAFLAFYMALTLLVLASLLLAFVNVVPGSVAPGTRAALEYVESIIGFYGVLLTLPILAHRVFAVPGHRRDRIVVAIVGLGLIVQHVTEYRLGGQWDHRGDLLENLLFSAVLIYTLALAIRRRHALGVDRHLAQRFLVLIALGIPVLLHDLFLIDVTGLRFYPLAYCVLSIVFTFTLARRPHVSTPKTVPPEWNLSKREAEVAMLVTQGLSNKEVAAELFISLNTVKTHVRAIFEKSGCRSRFALISAIVSEHPH